MNFHVIIKWKIRVLKTSVTTFLALKTPHVCIPKIQFQKGNDSLTPLSFAKLVRRLLDKYFSDNKFYQ